MISTAVTTFLVSGAILSSLVLLTQKERRRGRRFFAVKIRAGLDRIVDRLEAWLQNVWGHFIKYILQLNWYYSIHSVLRTILRVTVAFYTYFENIFERNRSRAKKLRAEKRQLSGHNHLQQVAQHKEKTALTPAQQRSLRKKKLEERH